MEKIDCPYCKEAARLTGGQELYPHREDLFYKKFWICTPCNAYVGCHPRSEAPLGTLANAELRKWRNKAHKMFDPLWQLGKIYNRQHAYYLLSVVMKIKKEDTHIGMFNIEQCKEVIRHVEYGTIMRFYRIRRNG